MWFEASWEWGAWFSATVPNPCASVSVSSRLGTLQAHSLHPSDNSSTDSLLLCSTVFAKNFHVAAAMKTSVLLSWEVPDSYKSAVPFKVGEGHSQSSLHAGLHGRNSSPIVGICVHSWCRILARRACTSSILQACDRAPPRFPRRFCTTGRVWRWMGTRCGS